MSHDNGFRRNDHDNAHGPAKRGKGHSKASQRLEGRLRDKREREDLLRRMKETQKADQ